MENTYIYNNIYPDNYEYFYESSNIIRTKLKTEEEIEEWVSKLLDLNKVTWSITRTIRTPVAKARKHIFKREYHCHFKTTVHKLNQPRKRPHPSRNIDCPAKMIIFIRHIPKRKSRAEVPDHLSNDWPCVIKFEAVHNHTIKSAAALTQRPISDETKNEIIEYFERGHSVASAFHSFCFKKMEEFGEQYDVLSSDRHVCPKKSDFENLWRQHFKTNYGDKTGLNMLSKLEENLAQRKDVSYKISHIGDHYAVSFCTPIMKRALEKNCQSTEILFVDATSNCDVQNHKLYFFATNSVGGGIPLGCIISTTQKEEVFDIAVKNLINISAGKISPKVIITDDDLCERKVLKKHWPSSTMLLCIFHVLKAVWKWLNMSKNNIPKEYRQSHYRLFRNILYAKSQSELEICLRMFEKECKFTNFEKYIKGKIDSDLHSWCLFYRKGLITRGSDTNNFIEVMFRIFKDIPLERTKAYNLPQLTDFVIRDFESYYKQRLLDLAFNKVNKLTIKRLCPYTKEVSEHQVQKVSDMQYVVASSNKSEKYFVDMNIGICSCSVGENGKICKHQAFIIMHFGIKNVINMLTAENKILLYQIATGSEPPKELLCPLMLTEASGQPSTSNCIQELTPSEEHNFVETHKENIDPSSLNINEIVSEAEDSWSRFIKKIDEDVKAALKDDPSGFSGAINSCVSAYNKNINSASSLLSGLFQMFKFNQCKPRSNLVKSHCKVQRKGKKIGVQPTSISRRKTLATGKRRMQSGRKGGSLTKKKTKAPHSLNNCVQLNISLGDNKFSK